MLGLEELPVFNRAILGFYHSRECHIVYPGTTRRMMLFDDWDRDFLELLICLNGGGFGGDRETLEPILFTSRLGTIKNKCHIPGPPRLGSAVGLESRRKRYIKKN